MNFRGKIILDRKYIALPHLSRWLPSSCDTCKSKPCLVAVAGHLARKGSGQLLDLQDEAGTFELSFCSTNLVGRNEACIFLNFLCLIFLIWWLLQAVFWVLASETHNEEILGAWRFSNNFHYIILALYATCLFVFLNNSCLQVCSEIVIHIFIQILLITSNVVSIFAVLKCMNCYFHTFPDILLWTDEGTWEARWMNYTTSLNLA